MKNLFQKKLVLILGLLSVWVAPVLAERAGDQGFGLMLGSPSGLSGKVWLDDRTAIDGAIGVARSELDVHASLLFHDFDFLKRMNIQTSATRALMPVYYGIGPRILFEDRAEFGIRLPVGLSVFPDGTPWEFFAEIAPIVRLTPDFGFNGDFAIGARYYFLAVRPKR